MAEGVDGLLRDKTQPARVPKLADETTHWTGRVRAKAAGVTQRPTASLNPAAPLSRRGYPEPAPRILIVARQRLHRQPFAAKTANVAGPVRSRTIAVLEPSARVDDKHACFLRRVALNLDRRVLR
jgi:hypothetical protein